MLDPIVCPSCSNGTPSILSLLAYSRCSARPQSLKGLTFTLEGNVCRDRALTAWAEGRTNLDDGTILKLQENLIKKF